MCQHILLFCCFGSFRLLLCLFVCSVLRWSGREWFDALDLEIICEPHSMDIVVLAYITRYISCPAATQSTATPSTAMAAAVAVTLVERKIEFATHFTCHFNHLHSATARWLHDPFDPIKRTQKMHINRVCACVRCALGCYTPCAVCCVVIMQTL